MVHFIPIVEIYDPVIRRATFALRVRQPNHLQDAEWLSV
jgi:hypothetical protein